MIRRARPDDVEAVVRIFHESRAEAMPWLPVLHTTHRQNYLVPPRKHRSFPLVELLSA